MEFTTNSLAEVYITRSHVFGHKNICPLPPTFPCTCKYDVLFKYCWQILWQTDRHMDRPKTICLPTTVGEGEGRHNYIPVEILESVEESRPWVLGEIELPASIQLTLSCWKFLPWHQKVFIIRTSIVHRFQNHSTHQDWQSMSAPHWVSNQNSKYP